VGRGASARRRAPFVIEPSPRLRPAGQRRLVVRSASKNADGTSTIFLGGSTLGVRLNVLDKDYLPHDQGISELVPVFARFKAERLPGEPFGDFCHRVGVEELAAQPDPA
jgi:sulfite reductase (ferredoxin)